MSRNYSALDEPGVVSRRVTIPAEPSYGRCLTRFGRRILLLVMFACPLVFGLSLFRVAYPELQVLSERLLIYLTPVMTMVATYFISHRPAASRSEQSD
jgi:hypothetical protein